MNRSLPKPHPPVPEGFQRTDDLAVGDHVIVWKRDWNSGDHYVYVAGEVVDIDQRKEKVSVKTFIPRKRNTWVKFKTIYWGRPVRKPWPNEADRKPLIKVVEPVRNVRMPEEFYNRIRANDWYERRHPEIY